MKPASAVYLPAIGDCNRHWIAQCAPGSVSGTVGVEFNPLRRPTTQVSQGLILHERTSVVPPWKFESWVSVYWISFAQYSQKPVKQERTDGGSEPGSNDPFVSFESIIGNE